MQTEPALTFGPYRLNGPYGPLVRRSQVVNLPPKALAVLWTLATQAGQVVTKEALLETVWPKTVVGEDALGFQIQTLRQALDDNARRPRYIETVHRVGYRFIGKVVRSQYPVVSRQEQSRVQGQISSPTPGPRPPTPNLVGREAELEQLHKWLGKALNGERQVVFVTGEPGIGKTALVEAFLQSLESRVQRLASKTPSVPPQDVQTLDPRRQTLDAGLWIGRGQCIEHFGAGEAYLPVLEALGRLCREPGGEHLIEVLAQQAPTWLVQMPALLNAPDFEALQRKTAGATRERMLRELAETVEALTAERPLVLWLEDLHWSDYSTLDWLAFVARRREAARVLVLGAYRPVAAILSGHPLKGVKQELQLHGQCEELALGFLTEGDVAAYLAVRFHIDVPWERESIQRLARVIHQRTDGNPLFMVNVVNDLIARGAVRQTDGQWEFQAATAAVEVGVPKSIHQMIEQQIDRLSPEDQRVLEVASVAGAEFSAAAVAAGVEVEVSEIEARCTGLVRREQFLRATGTSEWPDGTIAARYGFLHALYREVVYERVTAGRRIQLHQRIGEREEQAYGEWVREIAVELAVHFERGRDYRRTVHYLQQAGENAVRRSAHQEAISHLTKGLELLKTLPDTPERAQHELTSQVTLGVPLMATRGYTAPEVGKTYARALELCQQVGKTSQIFPALSGLYRFYNLKAELRTSRELAEQFLTLAESEQHPALLLEAHYLLGLTLFCLGEFALAQPHLEQGLTLYDPQQHRPFAFLYGTDLQVGCFAWAAAALWFRGYPAQALHRVSAALTLAQELSHPFSLAFALNLAAWLHQLRREGPAAQELAEAAIAVSTEQGFPFWLAWGTILRGWALAEQGQAEEEVAQMRQGLAAYRATGAEWGRPHHLALLAEAYGKAGQAEEGLAVLAEALDAVNKTGERSGEAELYRLKGELALAQSRVQGLASSVQKEAEDCFLKAIEVARRQQAKSLELRAVMSLGRLWQQQRKKREAHQMLAEIYNWFTEGFDTADLKEVKVLLKN